MQTLQVWDEFHCYVDEITHCYLLLHMSDLKIQSVEASMKSLKCFV